MDEFLFVNSSRNERENALLSLFINLCLYTTYDKEKGGFDIEPIFRNAVLIRCRRGASRRAGFFKSGLAKAPLPDQPILDAGCGTGQTAAYLGHLLYPVTVVDKDPIMLEKAKKDLQMKGLPSLHIRQSWNISCSLLSPFPASCQNRSSVFRFDALSPRNFKSIEARRDADWY